MTTTTTTTTAPAATLAMTPAAIVGVAMMDATEARQIVANINRRFEQSRKDLLELEDREGWKALGYDSWRDCVQAEFQQSAAYLYRQLAAAKVEQLIESPIGEMPESHLRPLTKFNSQTVIKKALDRADQLAGDKPRTAKHVTQAAAEIAAPELPIDYAIVQRRFAVHGIKLRHDAGTFVLLDRDGAESRTRVWDQVLDRLSLLEDGMDDAPAPAPVRLPAVPTRPKRPMSADASAVIAYLKQLEVYASALESVIMALQKRSPA